jgi:hypothetical protein
MNDATSTFSHKLHAVQAIAIYIYGIWYIQLIEKSEVRQIEKVR